MTLIRTVNSAGERRALDAASVPIPASGIPSPTYVDSGALIISPGGSGEYISTSAEIPLFDDSSNPAPSGTADPGVSAWAARSDHVHPGASYAQIYVAAGVAAQTTNATPGTFDVMTGLATNGTASGCTPDAANDKITCSPAGIYLVDFMASFSGSPNETYECELYNATTATAYTQAHFERKLNAAGDIGAASFSALISVADGDELKVRVACPSGASKAFTLRDACFKVTLVAETGGASAGSGGLLTTKGDLLTHDGSVALRFGVGSDGDVLTADSGEATGLSWVTPSTTPAGSIVMYGGAAAPTGWLLCDGTSYATATYADLFTAIGYTYGGAGANFNVPDLQGRVPIGLKSTDTDFDALGETGGAKTVASSGTNSAPTFTGSALGTHQHAAISAGTPSGSNAAEAAHTHSVTSDVTVADHASHTHTYTDVVNHTHTVNVGSANDTSTVTGAGNYFAGTTSTVAATAANPAGGVASGTTAGPSAILTHTPTNNAVTSGAGSSHNHAFTGNALATHQHDAISAGTPAGSVSAPTFTGAATSVVQPYIVLNYIIKT